MTDPRPQPYPDAPSSPATARNTLGTVALIVSLVVVVLGAIQQTGIIFLGFGGSVAQYGLFTGVVSVLSAIAAGAGLVLGLIALSRPGGRLRTGIALGISGTALISLLLSVLVGAIAAAM